MRRTPRRHFSSLFVQPLEDRCVPSATLEWGPSQFEYPTTQVPAFSDLTSIPQDLLAQTTYLNLTDLRAVSIDLNALRSVLNDAPKETLGAAVQDSITVSLPTRDGQAARFKVWEVSDVEPGYVTLNPDMKTFRGQGIDDPYASIAADIGSYGFHASVRTPEGNWYVEPYYHMSQSVYAVYDRSDVINTYTFSDAESIHEAIPSGVSVKAPPPSDTNTSRLLVNGDSIRSFRLAVAATAEYTAKFGGAAGAEAAIKATVLRINQVYEPELAVRFILVSNNTSLIFTDTTTDDYTSGTASSLIGENQLKVNGVIGAANYDIGHVFDAAGSETSFNGQAALKSVGNDAIKARGVSISGNPSSTFHPFVECVLHEFGHQFGANHTYNGEDAGLSERNADTAREPGSGTTIMSYGYNASVIPANNFQGFTDDYFHIASLHEMTDFLATIPNVGSKTGSGNTPPFANAGDVFTIPARTPFVLSGTGTDADNDPLTFTWEQFDLGPARNLPSADDGKSPLFRSVLPTPGGNIRSFPNLATVLDGTAQNSSGPETAITTTRTLNFRLTVRDNRPDRGGYHSSSTQVHAVDTGSAFGITNFNGFGTEVFAGTKQTVTWNVAGTTGNGINTNLVIIDLSTDGGNTFTAVSSFEANDGSAEVTLPANAATAKARFRVRASGNIFYDISNVDFTIKAIPSFEVYSPFDSGPGTLRQVILDAIAFPGVQTITFDPNYFNVPRTLSLSSGELPITEAVTINGPGSSMLTITGNNSNRIFNTDAAPAKAGITIRGVTLTAGRGADGGAIYIGNESVTIEDSIISNSSATQDGGAINVENAGTLILLRSTISGNIASDDGGGIYFNNGGTAALIDSALVNNKASTGNGGGLYFFGTAPSGGLSIFSSTISGNSAAVGGGGIVLPNFSGTLDVVNSTVTANYTFDVGGGGIARTSGTGTINLFSSIVSGNTGPSFAPDVLSSGTVNVNYSAIGSTTGFTLSGSNNIIGQNLKLRPLASNGGPTPTVAFEFDSPLRNIGSPNAFFPNDQRGFPRGSESDIGAFELLSTVTNTSNSGLGSLRDAVAESNRVVGTDTINFGSAFNTPQTINLQTGELVLTEAVTIQGNGESLTRISGLGISRIFNTTAIPAGKNVTLRGLTLTAGSAAGSGGAILSEDEVLVVEDSVISNSSATNAGGGIYVGTGKLTLMNASLVGNRATDLGGALRFVTGGHSEIIASSLVGNKAGNGGAIYLSGSGSTLTVLNSTLSGNSAAFGGGITTVDFFGALTVRNSTLTANTATNSGGGVRTFNGAPNIHVESTIVAGNTASFGPDMFSSATITVNRSAIGSADGFTLTGANNLAFGTNLKLGALNQNGGPTLTHLPANDSPLINAGSNPASLATDQRGVSRTLFGTTDIGSVESTVDAPDTTAPTILSITSDTPNSSYGPGSVIDIRVNFSEPVTLIGTLSVLFNNGGVGTITAQQPNFTTLTGSYTVAAGQATPDLNVTGFTLTGGSTLRDAANNNAVFTLPTSNLAVNKDIVITTPDITAPTITSITSPTPNGTYGPGASIGVALNFSEPVTLNGYLHVFLDTGAGLIIAGPQTGMTLNGTYSVGFNQNSADLNVTAVVLATGTLRDAALNDAVLTLPASNLANNAQVVVSTPLTPVFTVTNTNDAGTGSLRQAVIDSTNTAGIETIVFDSSFNTARTITLTSGAITIPFEATITGPGAVLLTITGNNADRVFNLPNASNQTVSISGVSITGGSGNNGGGISVGTNRTLNLVDTKLYGNTAISAGGGIWLGDSSTLNLTRSTLSGNTAGSTGGGFSSVGFSGTVTDSTITGNSASFAGGFYAYTGLTVRNSTISGNSSAGAGGGIATGGITIHNSTITNNTANSGGGGITRTFGNGAITVVSSIVSGNTAPSPDISSGGTVNVNFSAIGSSTGFTLTGGNNVPFGTNLMLGSLASNGGPTLTHLPAAASPLVNAGSNPAVLTTDQRGLSRSAGVIDIGSVEVQSGVTGIVVNDGTAQRSRLTKVVVTFVAPVSVASLGTISFIRTMPNDAVQVNVSNGLIVSPASGTVTSITLTFQNIDTAGLDHGSLADGRWQLALPGLGYQSPLNDASLRRLFGDSNNDGTVSAVDFAEFGSVFGATVANSAFDFDNNGTISAVDFAEFGSRFGLSL